MDWLTNIKSFIDVVDHQSFSKAAEKRYSSPAAISRRISWLEDKLGVVLIQRTTRKLQITEEGKVFYQKGKGLLANLAEITAQVQTKTRSLKGPLKVTMPYAFGDTRLVSHVIKNFINLHSDIELTLDFSNQLYDLVSQEVDVGFRTSQYHTIGYETVFLANLPMGIYAAPHYLAKAGTPKKIADLAQHNCLLHHNIGYVEWEFKKGKKQLVAGTIRSNSSRVLITFAKAGSGIIKTLSRYVDVEVKAETLVPVLEKFWPQPMPLYLVYRAGNMMPARIKAFIEFIQDHITDSDLGLT